LSHALRFTITNGFDKVSFYQVEFVDWTSLEESASRLERRKFVERVKSEERFVSFRIRQIVPVNVEKEINAKLVILFLITLINDSSLFYDWIKTAIFPICRKN
jgi:hypothetical protein